MPSVECRNRGARTPAEEIKRRGWVEEGILVVDQTDDRLTWPERELIRQIGRKLYGETEAATA